MKYLLIIKVMLYLAEPTISIPSECLSSTSNSSKDLSFKNLVDDDLQDILINDAKIDSVIELILSHNELSKLRADQFYKLEKLEILDLSYNQLSNISKKHIVCSMKIVNTKTNIHLINTQSRSKVKA